MKQVSTIVVLALSALYISLSTQNLTQSFKKMKSSLNEDPEITS